MRIGAGMGPTGGDMVDWKGVEVLDCIGWAGGGMTGETIGG